MPMSSARGALLALLSIALAGSLGHDAKAAETREVNVYSYRQPYLIDPLFKKNGHGAVIPITIHGSREKPEFGLDVKKSLGIGS